MIFVLQVKPNPEGGQPNIITYPVVVLKPEMKGIYNFHLYDNPNALLTLFKDQILTLLPLSDEEVIQMQNQMAAKP